MSDNIEIDVGESNYEVIGVPYSGRYIIINHITKEHKIIDTNPFCEKSNIVMSVKNYAFWSDNDCSNKNGLFFACIKEHDGNEFSLFRPLINMKSSISLANFMLKVPNHKFEDYSHKVIIDIIPELFISINANNKFWLNLEVIKDE